MDKILIIEDSQAQAEYLKSILRPDYEVTICLKGEEGFRKAKAEAFSLIFLDIILPDVDGFTLLKKLQEAILTKYTPVILVSGLADVQHEEKGLTLGAVDYITKPSGGWAWLFPSVCSISINSRYTTIPSATRQATRS